MCKGIHKTGSTAVEIPWKITEGVKQKKVKVVSGEKVKVDACIARLIKVLNEYGIETIYSCCGHGGSKPSIRIHPRHIKFTINEKDGSLNTWLEW